jgi:hypothetical protein
MTRKSVIGSVLMLCVLSASVAAAEERRGYDGEYRVPCGRGMVCRWTIETVSTSPVGDRFYRAVYRADRYGDLAGTVCTLRASAQEREFDGSPGLGVWFAPDDMPVRMVGAPGGALEVSFRGGRPACEGAAGTAAPAD